MTHKAQKAAEEYWFNAGDPGRDYAKEDFLAGIEWLKKELLEGKDGFNEKAVVDYLDGFSEVEKGTDHGRDVIACG